MSWTNELLNPIETIHFFTTIHLGPGAIQCMGQIAEEMKAKGEDKVLVVTGKSAYVKSGAWASVEAALKASGLDYQLFSEVTPNPDDAQVAAGAKAARDFGAKAVIAIGGGSSIDAAKAICVMALYPEHSTAELMFKKFTAEKALPLIAINLTHGTSSEGHSGFVISIPALKLKPATSTLVTFPRHAIDDANLMSTLPRNQTLFTTVDALSHSIEAATDKMSNTLAVGYAADAIEHIAESLPRVLDDPNDVHDRSELAYAAMIAGQAFCNGPLHIGHAIEHPMSSINTKLAHGLGLGVLLPATTAWIYKYRPETLAYILRPIVPGLKGTVDECDKVRDGIQDWLHSVGFDYRLKDAGFEPKDIDTIAEMTMQFAGKLFPPLCPGPVTKEDIAEILKESV